MKMRRALLAAGIMALVLVALLVSFKEYYVAIALAVGIFIIGRCEFWHLIRKRRLPPFDERVRENMRKSARNGFIFFAIASAVLMLFSSINLSYVTDRNPVHLMSGLFLAGGLVYLLSYIFYDRVEPKLGGGELRRLKTFLQVAGIAAGAGVSSFILHNAVSALLGLRSLFSLSSRLFCPPGRLRSSWLVGWLYVPWD